jgi:hypothetical protein
MVQFVTNGLAATSYVSLFWSDTYGDSFYTNSQPAVNGINSANVLLPNTGDWKVSVFSTNPIGFGPPTTISYTSSSGVYCYLSTVYSNQSFYLSAYFPSNLASVTANLSLSATVLAASPSDLQSGSANWNVNVPSPDVLTSSIEATITSKDGSCTASSTCSADFVDCSPKIPLGAIVISSNTTLNDAPSAPIVIASGAVGMRPISDLILTNSNRRDVPELVLSCVCSKRWFAHFRHLCVLQLVLRRR